jgi:hypothetical protein|tara:strand:+ start:4925 stop:5056 length:132 start_codon:yes stop_codon:yes gene_type:complete
MSRDEMMLALLQLAPEKVGNRRLQLGALIVTKNPVISLVMEMR